MSLMKCYSRYVVICHFVYCLHSSVRFVAMYLVINSTVCIVFHREVSSIPTRSSTEVF